MLHYVLKSHELAQFTPLKSSFFVTSQPPIRFDCLVYKDTHLHACHTTEILTPVVIRTIGMAEVIRKLHGRVVQKVE